MQLHHSAETVRLARSLLDQGWSLRRTARQLRLSPRTLDRLLRKAAESESADPVGSAEDPSAIPDDPFTQARRRARRCPGCGGLVFHWPCLTCQMQGRAQRLRAA